MLGKLLKQVVLYRQENRQLIAKEVLERLAAISKAWPVVSPHGLPMYVTIADAVMVPSTQSKGRIVLRAVLADAPAAVGNVLDGSVPIQVTSQQAWQAAAM